MGFECKAGDNKPSVLQEKNLQHIQDNKGIAMVVNENTLLSLQNFLDEMGK